MYLAIVLLAHDYNLPILTKLVAYVRNQMTSHIA